MLDVSSDSIDGDGRSPKNAPRVSPLAYGAAFLAGMAVDFGSSAYLSSPWLTLGWRAPVSRWLIHSGVGSIAGYWGVFWTQMPTYGAMVFIGAALGALLPGRGVQLAAVVAIGTVVGSVCWMLRFSQPDSPTFFMSLWYVLDIPFAVAPAGLLHWFRRPHGTNSREADSGTTRLP